MAKEIVWTRRGLQSLTRIVDYLQIEWSEKVISNFLTKLFNTLELLSHKPELGTLEIADKNIRGIVITSHNHLYYRVTSNSIIVLNLFDNRSGRRKKKF